MDEAAPLLYVLRNDLLPLGVGVLSQGPMAAATANAVANAAAMRIRHLPSAPARVTAALAS